MLSPTILTRRVEWQDAEDPTGPKASARDHLARHHPPGRRQTTDARPAAARICLNKPADASPPKPRPSETSPAQPASKAAVRSLRPPVDIATVKPAGSGSYELASGGGSRGFRATQGCERPRASPEAGQNRRNSYARLVRSTSRQSTRWGRIRSGHRNHRKGTSRRTGMWTARAPNRDSESAAVLMTARP